MSKAVNSKWKKTFPDTIGNQNRPATGVDDTQPFETGAFPQYMANDPVRYDLQNAAMSQSMSNDARLKEMVDARGKELDDHKVDPGAHKTGIAGNAATATKVVTTAATGASANIAEASMAGNDVARIRVSGASNAGELALETADDGTEPIVARQYTGVFKDVARTAAILDTNGNTSFPGTVVAPKFTGALNGNAATASKLATPRTISLTGKAAGSTSFDGSANASINVTSVNADTASKLSTARKINITGNATGAANFDGSGDANISVSVSQAAHADNADNATHAAAADTLVGSTTILKNDIDTVNNSDTWIPVISNGKIQHTEKLNMKVGAAVNADKLGGYPLNDSSTGGNWGTVPRVGKDGVIEVGRYIDWHATNGGGANYTARFEAQDNGTVSVGTINGTLNGTATNADTVDGVHAGSMFYNKGNWAADNWATIGTYQVNGSAPNANWYGWGQVISSSTNDARFQLYASHLYGGDGRLHYRTGWDSDKGQPWNTILDSENYNNFATQTISKIYPVGSIYMSMSATNPATLFGVGTWKRISQGRMLLGADDSGYKAGATGGEATHTLTVNEMPAHSHGISNSGDHTHNFYGSDNNNGPLTEGDGLDTEGNGHFTHNVRFTTSSAGAHTHTISNSGGGAAHNNMPPYLVCYIWQRTA